jgi:hypothetical protein
MEGSLETGRIVSILFFSNYFVSATRNDRRFFEKGRSGVSSANVRAPPMNATFIVY